jgi:hypothetical protein
MHPFSNSVWASLWIDGLVSRLVECTKASVLGDRRLCGHKSGKQKAYIGYAVQNSEGANPGVSIYDEMVALLWQDGKRDAAIRLILASYDQSNRS